MTGKTALDPGRRYLVPVARLRLPDEPDVVHLSVYQWIPGFQAWATSLALCGYSTEQGPLDEGTEVTCPDCQAYQPEYQAVLDEQAKPAEGAEERKRRRAAAGDTTENGAWMSVWLHGHWPRLTRQMTTPQREYAADCVAAYSRHLAAVDGDLGRPEPAGLRWWREAGR